MSERKILIVDDDIEILRALGKTFTTILPGYLLLTATSGNEGLNMVKLQNPDVVIVDVRLGSESGMDLVKEFHTHSKQKWSKPPRFIVITAYQDKQIMKEAIETYQVDKFLIKPFVSGEIEEAVLESLEKCTKESYEKAMTAITFARSYMKKIKEKAMAHQAMLHADQEKLRGKSPVEDHGAG
ncbi:MAG: hypothetical protein A3G87_06695 [Omnitrophica bacterium RIFCSPLOWO2_12_FULL_50_11]|nr:MAG: hypothetical protein A3G87_06695 [Omnitrophica bacterium RIFCSPLOWO2_12_FULL_50_11]